MRAVSAISLPLRRASGAPVTADVRPIDYRLVVWVELGGTTRSGFRGAPLSSAASDVVAYAACTARDQGLPLVVV